MPSCRKVTAEPPITRAQAPVPTVRSAAKKRFNRTAQNENAINFALQREEFLNIISCSLPYGRRVWPRRPERFEQMSISAAELLRVQNPGLRSEQPQFGGN
jgi:hypothetical protein